METSDETLVELATQGNGEAFGDLLRRHYDSIYRIAFRVMGSREDAEDLAQEVCASLPKKLKSFAGRAKFTTWLHQITINASRDLIRRKQAARRKADGWGEVEILRRDEAAQTQAELDWLTTAMNAMSDDLRETVALVLGEEMTHAEAGEILGISEGTVSWRMSEVKKTLRDMARKEEMLK